MTDFSDNNNVLSNMNIWFSRCDDSRGREGEEKEQELICFTAYGY